MSRTALICGMSFSFLLLLVCDGVARDCNTQGGDDSPQVKTASGTTDGCKLPIGLMPMKGRILDLDFESGVSNKVFGTKVISREKDWTVRDGTLFLNGERKADLKFNLSGLTFDEMTFALSFCSDFDASRLRPYHGGKSPILELGGEYHRMFAIRVDTKNEMLELEFNHGGSRIQTDLHVGSGGWNWLVCSLDAVGRKVALVTSQGMRVYLLPDDFAWTQCGAPDMNQCRQVRFGIFKGRVDDFIVYDYAFLPRDLSGLSLGRLITESTHRNPVICDEGLGAYDGKWHLKHHRETSLYWNMYITDGGWRIDARREGNVVDLRSQVLGEGGGALYVDLSIPVVDENGNALYIRSVGNPEWGWDEGKNERIRKVILPNELEILRHNAFSDFTRLKTVIMPKSLQKMERFVFSRCRELESIVIPANVLRIDVGSFADCGMLTNVVVLGKDVEIDASAFGKNCPIGKIKFGNGRKVTHSRLVAGANVKLQGEAAYGRMKTPLLQVKSASGSGFYFGRQVHQVTGCGGVQLKDCPMIPGGVEIHYDKVGPDLCYKFRVEWKVDKSDPAWRDNANKIMDSIFAKWKKVFGVDLFTEALKDKGYLIDVDIEGERPFVSIEDVLMKDAWQSQAVCEPLQAQERKESK